MDDDLTSDSRDSTGSPVVPSIHHMTILQKSGDPNHEEETSIQTLQTDDSNMYYSRRQLDQRITSRISKLRAHHKSENLETDSIVQEFKINTEGILKVLKMKSISQLTNSTDFRYQHGILCTLAVGEHIILGTSKGDILSFDFAQNEEAIFQDKKCLESGAVTALALSADSTTIAAGYENGTILVWDIKKPASTTLIIPGLSPFDLKKGDKEGHLIGSAILHLSFVGRRHTALISADNEGLFCYHNGYRNVLGYHVISRKILGKYSTDSLPKSHILCAGILPLGTSVEATDNISLTAIMTPRALVVISLYPQLQTHFKIGRPNGTSKMRPMSACLSWLPALITSDGGRTPPKLCYCWSNYLTLFDVNHEVMTNYETNEESVFVKFENKKRWVGKECFVAVQWLNSKIIAALTSGHRLLLISEATMSVLTTVDLIGRDIRSLNLLGSEVFENIFANSFKAFKGRIFFIGESEMYVTSLNNWADSLMTKIQEGDYVGALKQARNFYSDENEDAIIYGLPSLVSDRQSVIFENVTQLMNATLDYMFNEIKMIYKTDIALLREFTIIYLQIYVDFHGKISLEYLDLIFEKFDQNNVADFFFNELRYFIIRQQIISLTPTILKLLVESFILHGKGDDLEELICLLDISTLDIDLTISLCRKHHLRDSLVYIWNVLLKDYLTPFFEFIKTIMSYNELDENNPEREAIRLELSKIFGYLTYTLTGRQYPTEDLIDFERVHKTKLNLYYALFNGASMSWPKGSGSKIHTMKDVEHEPAFPYICLLLKFDCFETLSALNEIFEDEFLNEDSGEFENLTAEFELKATRQYIIGILFEVFKFNALEFSHLDKTILAIFVARNYPKFKQFITLSGSTCEELIETLCSYPDPSLKEDCELSLQSLLSVYHPLNVNSLIYFFERAGFYDVLFNVYRSEQKFHKVLEIWLSNKERAHSEKDSFYRTANTYETDSDIVRKCFELTVNNASERSQVLKFIEKNFEALVKDDLSQMIKLFTKFAPNMNAEILNTKDEFFCYKYLSILFDDYTSYGMTPIIQRKLRMKYIELLSKFDKGYLFELLKGKHFANDVDTLIPILKKNRAIDSVVLLEEFVKDYPACIKEITEYLSFLKSEIIKILDGEMAFEKFESIELELWKYLIMGVRISDLDAGKHTWQESLTFNEWLWLALVESTVDILKAINNRISGRDQTSNETYILDVIKRLVQDLFASLINSKSVDETRLVDSTLTESTIESKKLSFINVFNQFLKKSSGESQTEVTRLSDVRLILNEIFLSCKCDNVLQVTVLGLINERIFLEFDSLHALKLKSLSSKKSECDSCGKGFWGSAISNDVYDSWRSNQLLQLGELNAGSQPTQVVVDNNAAIIFKCGHGYHSHCLQGLTGGNRIFCVLCED